MYSKMQIDVALLAQSVTSLEILEICVISVQSASRALPYFLAAIASSGGMILPVSRALPSHPLTLPDMFEAL